MRRMRLTSFVALYRGRTVAEAELIAVSAEQRLVSRFFEELLGEPEREPDSIPDQSGPRVLGVVRDE
jgi:hypothetical protein